MKIYKKVKQEVDVLDKIICDKCEESICVGAEYLHLAIVTQDGRWYWAKFEGNEKEFCSIACILNFIENDNSLQEMINDPEFKKFHIEIINKNEGDKLN